jgi:hypothetical protein
MFIIIYGGLVFDARPNNGGWIILFEVTSFYLLFELWLNMLRKLPWDYLGKNSKLDVFFSTRRPLYYVVKILSLILLALSIYKIV